MKQRVALLNIGMYSINDKIGGKIMKKIMFVGAVGVGKTTLMQRLKGLDIKYYKTQAVQYYDTIIDTPGEFLQHRKFYNALMVTAVEAEVIGLLIAANEKVQLFPQGFSSLFNQPTIGIITKIDLLEDTANLECAKKQLQEAGVKRIFEISSLENEGIDLLEAYLRDEE